MRRSINILKTGLSVSYLAIAACSGSGNSASSPSSDIAEASIKAAAAAAAGTVSPSGTTIPAATKITDSSANVWTLAAGVVHENGASAGYSKAVTLILYDNKIIYQENSAGGWWSWSDSTWAPSSDPRKTASASLTTIPAATQITDGSGNVWVVSGGMVYKNGVLAGYSSAVTELIYDKSVIYQENSSDKWWSWSGTGWASSSDPVTVVAGAPTISGSPATVDNVGEAYSFVPTTTNPGGGVLSFSIANTPAWAKFSTVTGALTGSPSNAQTGAYADIGISVTSGGLSASLARFAIDVSAGFASLSWTAPTENTNGTKLTDLAGYTISYGTSPSDLSQTAQVDSSSATTYVVENLSSGTYYFKIAANATDGTHSVESAEGSKVIL
jgi:hypothetical protein